MDVTINKPQINKAKKSVSLTETEMELLRTHVSKFPTETQAALSLGIDRNVLNRTMAYGRGAEKSIEAIRENLPK